MKDKGLVILIHGFLAAPWTMTYYEKKLNEAGFDTVKWGYPSRKKTIQEHAQALVEFLKALPENGPVNFVTHTLGGLVLRAALSHPECPKNAQSGKAVLITPPNQGVLLGRMLSKWTLARKLCGKKSGKELLTANEILKTMKS
ncbi:MAG: alpha/beta hydrolase [Chlamydiia bacterium]|nr:alpha/beta hydrolase [Chlamydiia bacterium]